MSIRVDQSSTTSAKASLPAARSSTGSRRQAGSTRKKVYATYCPSTGVMVAQCPSQQCMPASGPRNWAALLEGALAGGADENPTERIGRERRLAALVRAGVDVADGPLHERAARLRRSVGVVHAGLPAVVVGLVGDVEDQEAAHRRLARGHP